MCLHTLLGDTHSVLPRWTEVLLDLSVSRRYNLQHVGETLLFRARCPTTMRQYCVWTDHGRLDGMQAACDVPGHRVSSSLYPRADDNEA